MRKLLLLLALVLFPLQAHAQLCNVHVDCYLDQPMGLLAYGARVDCGNSYIKCGSHYYNLAVKDPLPAYFGNSVVTGDCANVTISTYDYWGGCDVNMLANCTDSVCAGESYIDSTHNDPSCNDFTAYWYAVLYGEQCTRGNYTHITGEGFAVMDDY
jgi:hypothetical protein